MSQKKTTSNAWHTVSADGRLILVAMEGSCERGVFTGTPVKRVTDATDFFVYARVSGQLVGRVGLSFSGTSFTAFPARSDGSFRLGTECNSLDAALAAL